MTEIVTAYKIVRYRPALHVFQSPIVPDDLVLEFEIDRVTRPEIPDSGIYCFRNLPFWSSVNLSRYRLLQVEGEAHPFQYVNVSFPLTRENLTRFWATRLYQDAPVSESEIVLAWVRPVAWVYPVGVHPDDFLPEGMVKLQGRPA